MWAQVEKSTAILRLEIIRPQALSTKVLSAIVAQAHCKSLRVIVALWDLNPDPGRSTECRSAVIALELQDIWRNELSVRCTTEWAVDASSFFLSQQISKDLLLASLLDFSGSKKVKIFPPPNNRRLRFCRSQTSLSILLLHKWPRRARR